MSNPVQDDKDIIIDPSKLVEPDESDEDDSSDQQSVTSKDGKDSFWFDNKKLTIEWESVVDDEEFDEERDDIYEPYEEDPSILNEDDDA